MSIQDKLIYDFSINSTKSNESISENYLGGEDVIAWVCASDHCKIYVASPVVFNKNFIEFLFVNFWMATFKVTTFDKYTNTQTHPKWSKLKRSKEKQKKERKNNNKIR